MSLWKAIEHGKEHRDIRHTHDVCRCERCRMNLLYNSLHRSPVDDEGKVIGGSRVSTKRKALKNGVTKNYKG